MYVFSPSSFPGHVYLTLSTLLVETSAIPGITGCYQPSDSVELFLPFILLFVLALGASLGDGSIHMQICANTCSSKGLVFLTLIRALGSWRITKNPLLTVLLKHNIFYYASGLCESAQGTYQGLFPCRSLIVLVPKFSRG
jgi:hypothetical protein